ncbi:SDR family NAD(P)-dependent oxidoreductase [Nocardia terrae]|nr:SDR family NAD(P)-dependent oxidoreductase [Nocardia terrae]
MPRSALDGLTVLITGAADGIGAATARQLIAQGARVALVDRDAHRLHVTAADLGQAALPIVADVTDVASIQEALAQTVQTFGGIHAVIANAGIMPTPTLAHQIQAADAEKVMAVNVLGVMNTVSASVPYLLDGGYILVTASLAALIPVPAGGLYTASKHAVYGYARTLRMELAHLGINVGTAFLGTVVTSMSQGVLGSAPTKPYWDSLPRFLKVGIPVDSAARAMVRGIGRRSTWVAAPSWVYLPLLLTYGWSRPLERVAVRNSALRTLTQWTPAVAVVDPAERG